jgi:hypothetical protein
VVRNRRIPSGAYAACISSLSFIATARTWFGLSGCRMERIGRRWIAPRRSRGNQRMYRQRDIDSILTVKRLLDEAGYRV